MAKRPARTAKPAAWSLAGTALIVPVLAVLINLRDPEISREARATAHSELPAIAAERNAYVALLMHRRREPVLLR